MSRRSRARRALRGAAAVAVAGVLASCVAPGGSGVQAIDPEDVPYGLLSPAPAPEPSTPPDGTDAPGVSLVTSVYLRDDDGVLRPAPLEVEPGTPAQLARQVLQRLEDGPSPEELNEGLSSALGPDLVLEVGGLDDGVVEVDVSGSTALPAPDLVPQAIGQIVLSLTEIDGVDAVRLVRDGGPLPLPLPGGLLTTDAVTGADYVGLTVP